MIALLKLSKTFNIFVIWESKLDASLPKSQFKINDCKYFRHDRNRYGGALMVYFNEGINCKVLANQTLSPNVEMMTVDFHQMKRKWLLLGVYKPPIQSDSEFTEEIIKTLIIYLLMKIFFYWVIST